MSNPQTPPLMFYAFIPLLPWIFLSINTSTPLLFNLWISLITGILAFYLIQNNTSALTVYIIEEGISFFIILIWILSLSNLLAALLITVNGALPPFHLWFIEAIASQNSWTLLWSLTSHNLPIYSLWVFSSSTNITAILSISCLLGSLIIWKTTEIQNIFILSSASTIGFIWLLASAAWLSSALSFLLYSTLLWSSAELTNFNINSVLLLFGLMGFPPLFTFQLNWAVIETFLTYLPIPAALLAATIASSLAYLRLLILINTYIPELQANSIIFSIWALASAVLPVVYL